MCQQCKDLNSKKPAATEAGDTKPEWIIISTDFFAVLAKQMKGLVLWPYEWIRLKNVAFWTSTASMTIKRYWSLTTVSLRARPPAGVSMTRTLSENVWWTVTFILQKVQNKVLGHRLARLVRKCSQSIPKMFIEQCENCVRHCTKFFSNSNTFVYLFTNASKLL